MAAPLRNRFRTPHARLAAVILLWFGAVVLAGPHGEFPLSDDWAYAHLVRSLCEGRGYDPLPWTGASAVVQAIYGTAVCVVAGFSHEALRWTTLAMSLIGVLAFHALLFELGASATVATAGAAVLAFSPLWFNQSFTFMTDVPFAALSIVASWLYVRALRRRHAAGFAVAGMAAAAAFLVRQHAVAIPVAAALAALWPLRDSRTRPGEASNVTIAAASLAAPFVAIAAYGFWAATAPEVPLAVRNKVGEALAASPLAMLDVAFRSLATLGLLYLPWALASRPRAAWSRAAFVALLPAAAFLYLRGGEAMFYLTNVLGDFTVGALTTRDTLFLARPLPPDGGAVVHAVLTLLSLAGAAALLAGLAPLVAANPVESGSAPAAPEPTPAAPRAAVFCALALALSWLITLVQSRYYFDRYLIVLLPLAMAATTAVAPRVSVGAGAIAAWAVIAVYSVAGTHDYMEWNRARWSLLEAAEARGATADRIDGGVEYNAVRRAAALGTAPNDARARSGQAATEKSWWWVDDDEWIVAFGPLEGYSESDSREFTRWLPPGRGRVLLLHREHHGQQDAADDTETGTR